MDEEERGYGRKILVWNIAGARRQGIGTWEFIKEHDFVSLCETWVTENDWKTMKNRMPETHEWECIFAIKEKRREEQKEDSL